MPALDWGEHSTKSYNRLLPLRGAMTISYTLKVADARFAGFSKLLFRWKGSIYKLLYKEFIVFISLYSILSVTYRYFLSHEQKIIFENVATYCDKQTSLIPMSFVLGFMTCDERKKFESLYSDFNKYWIPCVWFTNLAAQARKEGRIRDDVALRLLMDVVTIAVYSFFAFCLIGRQFLEPRAGYEEDNIDFYVPVFTLLQFFFYAGWLKVAEQIINPFGEDDDDFETNKLIDRNLQVSFLSVDDMYQNLPPMQKDKYWNETTAQPPYTIATANEVHKPSFLGSTYDMRVIDSPVLSRQIEQESEMELRMQTPLLSRFLNVAASPAISLKTLGRSKGGANVSCKRVDSSSSNFQPNELDLVVPINEKDSQNEDQHKPSESSSPGAISRNVPQI
ncbi:hypothetical protein scyTo_0011210 [Scyliorhinus torazame]|uniref:Bestrophin homolog n=1 Tax=Scyliorhinus torazame TaxID=75743 RepID=A0A401NJ29_SCYTO|nr:hypothetical protein [Scyliorhinus torazame]